MRALNPNITKLTTVKEDDNTLAQPKPRSVSGKRSLFSPTSSSFPRPSSSSSSSAPANAAGAVAAAAGSASAAPSSTLTSKPRPSSRQSAVSNSSLTVANINNNNISRKPGPPLKQHAPSSDAQRQQRISTPTTSRPPVITTTVTRNPRLAAAKKTAAPRPAPLNLTSVKSIASAPKSSPAVILSPASVTSNGSTVSSSSHASTKPALRSRDQNAPQMTQHSSISKPGRMPHDRASGTNNNGTPRIATLSATAARGANSRGPLTPKIASKSPQTATVPANARSPFSRAQPRPPIGGFVASGPTRTPTQQEDDVFSHLNTNITPRTGTRQGRVDSTSSTPNGTPDPERSGDNWDHDLRSGLGLSPSLMHGELPKRSQVTFSPIPTEARGQPRHEAQNDLDSKFFYASDAKGTQHQQQAPTSRPVLAKAPVFFYANGSSADNKTHHPPLASPPLAQNSSQDGLSSKFMYANGMPELRASPPGGTSRPGSVISTTSRTAPTSRPGTGSQGPSLAKRPTSLVGTSPAVLRRSSTGASRRSHSRSSSMISGSLVMGEPSFRNSFTSSGPASPMIEQALNPPPLTLASIIQAAEEFADDDDDADESTSIIDDAHSETHSGPQSPARSTHSADPVSELVANARRERKVQDLQITNASLEAINRTLERQLRKQTAELRRYKRLSRSGRLSIVSLAESTRPVSETGSTNGGDEQQALSNLGEDQELEAETEEDEVLTDTDTASEELDLSSSMMAEKDEKHLEKDEKRLQVDLSKHQQLLIDSQKINQSIKRCLDWTEELIKEGRKALEYSVRPHEVEIPGPRVLNPVDEEEEATQNSIIFKFSPEEAEEDTIDFEDEPFNLEEDLKGPDAPITPRLAGWCQNQDPMDRAKGNITPN